MKVFQKHIICLAVIFFVQQNLMAQLPQLYLVDVSRAAAAKKHASVENIKQLSKQADKLLNQKFGSVMDKKFTPPCGNMHEYMSMARYYWPDPTKPDGKPYIKKDGQKNPANDLVSDDRNFDILISSVNTLSWTYYFTDDEKYAAKAIQLIRLWFIDTATNMLPNLNHAQIRTGIDTGASTGIIDTHNLPQVVDGIGLLRSSKYWKQSDEVGTRKWFKEYLNWMVNSKNGKKEGEAKNNHGTFYDMQVASIALFCGEKLIADKILKNDFARLASQIEPDGKQPLELERTLALGYSTFNLQAWCLLANIAEKNGVDFWNYQTSDGRSIKKAFDYLVPYVTDGKSWEYQQINTYKTNDFYYLLLMAADKFKNDTYKQKAEKIKDSNKNILIKILYE
jgi:hypothetical protein